MAVIGTFATKDQVRDAIDQLMAGGIPADAISAVTPGGQALDLSTTTAERVNEVATSAGLGALIGAAAGVTLATVALPGIGVVLAAGPLMLDGALAGGLIGALAKWGFGEEHAAHVAERLQAGRYLVVVHTADTPRAESVLMNTGAEDVRVADQPA